MKPSAKTATGRDIPFHRPYITEEEVRAVSECLRNGWLTMGRKTLEFEERFRIFVGASHAVAVNSCTAAQHLALKAIGLGEGDEVILPALTFASTAETVLYFNARVVMADVEKDTHLIDVGEIEKRITPRTRAIVPVHYGGQPADMDEIREMAHRRNIAVIDDAAHSLPASYRGRPAGSLGDITCFSFYATKTLATGEGGMITTENAGWAERMRILRLHGISSDAWKRYSKEGSWVYDVTEAGYKYNITDIASALGLEQLKKQDFLREERERIARRYDEAFTGDAFLPYLIKGDRTSARHLYPLRLNTEALTITRDRFVEELKARGVGVSVHYIPLYRISLYRDMVFQAGNYTACEWIFSRCLSLPLYPGMQDEEIDYVISHVRDIAAVARR